jgi:hypothetical protein
MIVMGCGRAPRVDQCEVLFTNGVRTGLQEAGAVSAIGCERCCGENQREAEKPKEPPTVRFLQERRPRRDSGRNKKQSRRGRRSCKENLLMLHTVYGTLLLMVT